ARGALEDAVSVYDRPFLEGFYLNEAPEFARWAEDLRGRTHRRVCAALEKLADNLLANGDRRSAVALLLRLAELDPLANAPAMRVVRTLSELGDRAAAIRFGIQYTKRVRDELGMAPDPAWVTLLQDLHGEPPQSKNGGAFVVPLTVAAATKIHDAAPPQQPRD